MYHNSKKDRPNTRIQENVPKPRAAPTHKKKDNHNCCCCRFSVVVIELLLLFCFLFFVDFRYGVKRYTVHMVAASYQRQQFVDLVSALGTPVLDQCAPFQSLQKDWATAIDMWRSKKVAEGEKARQLRAAAEQTKRSTSSLRERRTSELLMADDLLKQAHDELDSLLAQTSSEKSKKASVSSSANASAANRKVSFQAALMAETSPPTNVSHFDGRLHQVVAAPYFTKAVDILLKLDPTRRVVCPASDVQQNVVCVADGEAAHPALAHESAASGAVSHDVATMAHIDLTMVDKKVVGAAGHALTELIDAITPNHWNVVLFNCRAACHFACGNIRLALRDSQRVAEMSGVSNGSLNDHEKKGDTVLALRRVLRCQLLMLELKEAAETLHTLKSAVGEGQCRSEISMLAHLRGYTDAVQVKSHPEALKHISALIAVLPSPSFTERRMHIVAQMDEPNALDIAASATLKYPNSSGLWYWYGVLQIKHAASFEQVEEAQRSLQRAVSLAGIEGHPEAQQELQRVRYMESKSAMAMAYHRSKRWRQAISEFTILITLQGVSKGLKLYFTSMRAKAFAALGRPTETINDTTYILNHASCTDVMVQAYMLRSEAYLLARDEDKARSDAAAAMKLSPRDANVHALKAKVDQFFSSGSSTSQQPSPPPTPPPQSRRSSRDTPPPPPPPPPQQKIPPHYRLLGVDLSASTSVITKAYRDAALKWHPDRWITASLADKANAEETFKKLNTAYQTLVDGSSRKAYDQDHGL